MSHVIGRLLSSLTLGAVISTGSAVFAQPTTPEDGSVLPFPPTPSASVAGPTLQESTHTRRVEPDRLGKGAPNILIILMDDAGFGVPSTFGGPVNTPTLSALAAEGISYNEFNTTSICSPTRAALLTGRNQHRVGSGTIAERAVDWDGYVGVIPKSSATIAEVLKQYGYSTAAFGKWHNTPAIETTAMGPFDRWPTGYGFEHFYGFLAGETSQYEPRLVLNTTQIEPHEDPHYILTADLADQAIHWLREHRSYAPDKPFFLYWAPGASHGPHHIFPEWADKYKGKFDAGWDALRETTFAEQKALGWIPADTKLTPRADSLPGWDSVPADQKSFQTRLMEVFAGMTEHADVQAGRVVDEIDRLGLKDNTIIFYIFGDNGSSAEGQAGTISELLAQNNIPSDLTQHIAAMNNVGGLSALGGPKLDSMYNAGWAWAGSTPFRSTKLVAAHFGGTRNPMVIDWPGHIQHDGVVRTQFSHVIDIAPTIYDILGIAPPKEVNGIAQDPIDGVSVKSTFDNPTAPSSHTEQYFENNGSRALYKDGWVAAVFGPLIPWNTAGSDLKTWDPNNDVWELYDTTKDFSEADDVSAQYPDKVAAMKDEFLKVAKDNKVFPVGAGLWLRLHPEDRTASPYTSWTFDATTRRMPEFTAPGLGRQSNVVDVDATFGDNASGVLYALGGISGGVTLYMDKGRLVYLYNMMIIEQYEARSADLIPAGAHKIEVTTSVPKPAGPAEVVITVDGAEVARLIVKRTVAAAFTPSETFDVGIDLGSPVALGYYDRRPFAFDGTIDEVRVNLK